MSDSDEYVPAYNRELAEQWVRAPWARTAERESPNAEPVELVSLLILWLLLRSVNGCVTWFPLFQEVQPVDHWCQCGNCHVWPSASMSICCKQNKIWSTRLFWGAPEVECICECEHIQDLLRPGPLRVTFHNYCTYHGMFANLKFRHTQFIFSCCSILVFYFSSKIPRCWSTGGSC